jgi:hypothetical protein
MKDGQKLKLGDAHVTPRNIQEVQASMLGDAKGTPFFINKNTGHMLCVFLGASFFYLSFLLFCLLE